MKESNYNIYLLDEKEQKGLVFNTIQRSIVQIDSRTYSLIRDNRVDEIDGEILEALKTGNMIIDDNLNELDMLKIIFNRKKYNANTSGFTIIPTHACNLACKYCYQGHGDVLSNTMNEETVRRTIEFIKKNSVVPTNLAVNFYGGEPLLFSDILFRILEELKIFTNENGMNLSVALASNGTLFTDEIAERLKEYKHRVQITLYGPKDIHDEIKIDKKGNGTYDSLMNVISLFKKHNISFHVRVDVDQINYNAMESLLEDLKRRGFEGIHVNFSPISKDACYTEMELETEEVHLASLARLSKMAHDQGFKTDPIYIHNFVDRCSVIFDNFFAIDPKGDVYKCMAAPNYTEHRLGTIDENGNLTNINYEAYCKWTLRDPLRNEECIKCKFSPICGGGCALVAYVKNSDINFPGCKEKDLEEIVRMSIMLRYPELFERCTYESIVL
jgi:uncharacterized protein